MSSPFGRKGIVVFHIGCVAIPIGSSNVCFRRFGGYPTFAVMLNGVVGRIKFFSRIIYWYHTVNTKELAFLEKIITHILGLVALHHIPVYP